MGVYDGLSGIYRFLFRVLWGCLGLYCKYLDHLGRDSGV